MISSRQPITSFNFKPLRINSWALPRHTSVPWDKPEICTKSEKQAGRVSSIVFLVFKVPNSGKPAAPVSSL